MAGLTGSAVPPGPAVFPSQEILGFHFDALDWAELKEAVDAWIRSRTPHMLTVLNVHSLVTARADPDFSAAVRASHLVVADSTPLVWLSRWLGRPLPARLAGPDLCGAVCRLCAEKGYGVFFMGSTPAVLAEIKARLGEEFPALRVAGTYSPPMKAVFSAEDDAAAVDAVNASGADVLWVGLTAPKQEKWIHRNLSRLHCGVAVGIGAAFDFMAGRKTRAPQWVQRAGLEWFFRFCQEPRRLWRRYLVSNAVFLALAAKELASVRLKISGRDKRSRA